VEPASLHSARLRVGEFGKRNVTNVVRAGSFCGLIPG
jgi:hypothetical protein